MSEWLGREYNYDVTTRRGDELEYFRRQVHHAGDAAPDFTLPTIDGGKITLSDLRGKPVVIEFGSHS